MAQDLKRPSAPHRISELPFHEPMRMTLKGEPIIGMKVGKGLGALLIIKKDGSITSIVDPGGATHSLVFIDYLLEDESFTVFGSATERSDEADFGPIVPPIVYPDIQCGATDFSAIPDFMPFYTRHGGISILIREHLQGEDYGYRGMILTAPDDFKVHEKYAYGWDWEAYGSADNYFERTYVFDRFGDPSRIGAFKNHHRIVDFYDVLSQRPDFPDALRR